MAVIFALLFSVHVLYYVSSGKAHITWCALLCCLVVYCSVISASQTQNVRSICFGDTEVLECSVKGNGSTVWTGSAFNCSSEIVLLHSQYNSSGVSHNCSDGHVQVYAKSLNVKGHIFTSQISVTVTSAYASSTLTINCTYDDGLGERVVKIYSIIVETVEDPLTCTNSTRNVLHNDQQSDMTGTCNNK